VAAIPRRVRRRRCGGQRAGIHNAADIPGSWDAEAYDQLSDPQYAWGRRILDCLALRGNETVVDAGCGTGRLTALLLRRVPRGRVIAVYKSASMVAKAKENLGGDGNHIIYLCAGVETIALARCIDAIFSTSTSTGSSTTRGCSDVWKPCSFRAGGSRRSAAAARTSRVCARGFAASSRPNPTPPILEGWREP
jgi:SAM-dependent methyltransferase